MTREKLEKLNAMSSRIDQIRKDIDAIENGPYGVPAHHLDLRAVYQNDPNTDYILTVSEESYPELRKVILSALKGKLWALEREFEEA